MSSEKNRKHYSSDAKLAIVREHLLEGTPVSDLCDRHGIHPTMFYNWQKTLFENGQTAFERKPGRKAQDPRDKKIARLEATLAERSEVIAELMAEHVRLKKENGEP